MLCVGNSIGVLAAGRALQGMSAAVVWVVGLALLADTVGGDEIGQVMGYVGLSMSLAILLSPLLAGVVFEKAGYYAVFAMCFGLIVLDILLRLIMVERKIAVQWIPEYAPKGEKARQVAPTEDNRHSVATIEMDADISASKPTPDNTTLPKSDHDTVPIPATEAEVWGPPDQSKWYNRLPPVIRLLASRRLVSALWACFIQASLLTSFDATLPLFVKNTFGWNSIGAGLIFLPICVPTFIGPVVGALSDKHGPRWYAVAGFLLCCPFLILLRLVGHNSMEQKVLLCALLALIGFALTLALTPMMAEITYAVVAKEARHPPGYFGKNGAFAQAYSLFNMAWAGGCLVGPLLAGLVVNASGWPLATLILGVATDIRYVSPSPAGHRAVQQSRGQNTMLNPIIIPINPPPTQTTPHDQMAWLNTTPTKILEDFGRLANSQYEVVIKSTLRHIKAHVAACDLGPGAMQNRDPHPHANIRAALHTSFNITAPTGSSALQYCDFALLVQRRSV
ncbi:hypothetical protein LTR95_017953 [Oleoguttula sp. CCFEE 5521]